MSALFWILLLIVLAAVFGGAIFALGWWLLWTVLIGFVIGLLGRVLVRNTGDLGVGHTILAGIAGSVVGGWIARWLDLGNLVQFVVAILLAAVFIGITSAGSTKQD